MMSKSGTGDTGLFATKSARKHHVTVHKILVSLVALLLGSLWFLSRFSSIRPWSCPMALSHEEKCLQAATLEPDDHLNLWNELNALFSTNAFVPRAVEWLGGYIRVPSVTYDSMPPVGEDERWNVHAKGHAYLYKTFPRVHSHLSTEKVNTWGLLYTWKGSDASLKPILLMGHQDVVPVDPNTVDQWTHAPFSGHFDGKYIWGRGSFDDKSGLIGILGAIELLLEKGFQPTRTVVLSFGFDEEAGGYHGAAPLSQVVIDRYGEDSFAFVVDEGGGFATQYGTVFASPGVAEKGSLNVKIEVNTAGGHSSIPPEHTSIGILSALLVHIEKNPFEVHLPRESTTYASLQCAAEHGKTLDKHFRKTIRKSQKSNKALRELEHAIFKDRSVKSIVGTTQAIDLIQGGVKSNALPEQAWALINHRIATDSSTTETKTHDAALLKDLASKFNLTYTAFGETLSEEGAPSSGSLTLTAPNPNDLEPAPVSPTAPDTAPYKLLSGTIKATYNAHRSLVGDNNIQVSPGIPSGNTDTRYFWPLTQHIYRYNHHNMASTTRLLSGIHTVNEHIEADAFVEVIRFFVTLILNADESKTI